MERREDGEKGGKEEGEEGGKKETREDRGRGGSSSSSQVPEFYGTGGTSARSGWEKLAPANEQASATLLKNRLKRCREYLLGEI